MYIVNWACLKKRLLKTFTSTNPLLHAQFNHPPKRYGRHCAVDIIKLILRKPLYNDINLFPIVQLKIGQHRLTQWLGICVTRAEWVNSCTSGRFQWYFQYVFSDWWLRYLMWSCPQMNVNWPYWSMSSVSLVIYIYSSKNYAYSWRFIMRYHG